MPAVTPKGAVSGADSLRGGAWDTILSAHRHMENARRTEDVMTQQILQISEAARRAFAALELPADAPQAIRVYFQGFG